MLEVGGKRVRVVLLRLAMVGRMVQSVLWLMGIGGKEV